MPDHDLVIVGGGPVGATLALALRDSGLDVAVLETRAAPESTDPRPLALSHGTRLILERLGLWQALGVTTPIARIHVSQRGGFGRVVLDAADGDVPALGYVLDYSRLARAMGGALRAGGRHRLLTASVTATGAEADHAYAQFAGADGAGRVTARLLVLADGGALAGERMHTVDYRQVALTARVTCEREQRNVAYERFTPEGPLALLPGEGGRALIWTTAPQRAQELCAATEGCFLAALRASFGDRLGRFLGVERRAWYPLVLRTAPRLSGRRTVYVGNAAQTLHPVAGQGLNLGLRDAWELAAEVLDTPRGELGGTAQLARYAARRRIDRGGGIRVTDGLVRAFASDAAPLSLARGLGLAALGAVAPAREFFVRRMIFGARG